MCEGFDGCRSKHLTEMLLNGYDLIIKNSSTKKGFGNGEYIRLAVKDEKSNAVVAALKSILK